ncbi:MAG: transcription termination factor Rho [Eubacterium sp.]|jgi:transcription termination factor Rho|nr:transcription termination factor Rho [Eubacterium sp.]
MREKYESLSVTVLKDLAKARGITHLSGMKKQQVVEAMLAEDEKEAKKNQESGQDTKEEITKRETGQGAKEDKISQKSEQNAGRDKKNQESTQEAKEEKTKRETGLETKEMRKSQENGQERKEARKNQESTQERREARKNQESVQEAKEGGKKEDIKEPETEEKGLAQETAGRDDLDSGIAANGILEVMPDGYGFIRCENYLPGEKDVYVSPSQIRKFNLKTGDIVSGNTRIKTQQEKFSALLYVNAINGFHPSVAQKRKNFEDLTPIFPNRRIRLEQAGASVAMRIVDLVSPIGKGQRGMIVSPPKAGKTTLLKQIAKAVTKGNPEMHLIILLIDERPEEVTDIKEAIEGANVEVIYSTFDELPEHHKRVSEMVIERAKRLVEHRKDVMILLDSITRLARAYNLTVPPSGRTLSGGLDPAALHMPKRIFGAARNMREGGSLTILASALVDTGSKMDDVIFEEFKGTGNMEVVLDRKLSEKRIFPALDIVKSSTRREDLLLDSDEQEAVDIMRKAFHSSKSDEAVESMLNMFARTKNNREYIQMLKKTRFF